MRKRFQKIVNEVSDEDYEAFMGENVDKFAVTRQRMLDGKLTSWDWMAFFFSIPWAINYRYRAILNFYLVMISFLVWFTLLDDGQIFAGFFMGGLFASIFALTLKMGYVKSAYRKIYKIKQKITDRKEQLEAIVHAGRTFKIFTWYNLLILVLFIIYSAFKVYMDVELQQDLIAFFSGNQGE